MSIYKKALLACTFLAWVQPTWGQGETFTVSGRLTDQDQHPLNKVTVRLLDERGQWQKESESAADGSFALVHTESGPCLLEVMPDMKSGLASAFIDHVPGNQNRNFVVALQRGFLVKGRIAADGKGVKNVEIRVTSTGHELSAKHVHDGGIAASARNGTFKITLTPGPKKLVVSNRRYPQLASNSTKEFTVTDDVDLGDIDLPAVH